MGESIRSKYLKERSRKDRPDINDFTNFLCDMGCDTYKMVGEVFSYRSYQLLDLKDNYKEQIRCINLVRHPYAWLEHFVKWRVNNLNMLKENNFSIKHEWSVTDHDKYKKLGLKGYKESDVEVWASFQGMTILNRMKSDIKTQDYVKNIPIENVFFSKDEFNKVVHYLSNERLKFDNVILNSVYKMTQYSFREKFKIIENAKELYLGWPKWKKEAYKSIVSDDVNQMFLNYGYML